MTIGQLARRAQVAASTIRYYEKLGLLPAPNRENGQRRYDDTAVQRLAVIAFAKYVGFSLTEISHLLREIHVRPPTDRWRQMAHTKMQDLDDAIQHASALKRMLADTLSQTCPKLVERGTALTTEGVQRRAASLANGISTPAGQVTRRRHRLPVARGRR